MTTRFSFIFQATTAPTDRASASPHIAGWSEGFWRQGDVTADATSTMEIAVARAAMLPTGSQLIGVRLAYYTLTAQNLTPRGTVSGKLQLFGRSGLTNDLPQVALQLDGKTASSNVSRFTLRGMPDDVMVGGEYQPSAAFKRAVTLFGTKLIQFGCGFVARDLSQPSAGVLALAASVLTLDAALPGVVAGDYIRLKRVYDQFGEPITGSYRISAAVGSAYTLPGIPANLTATGNGSARLDRIAFRSFTTVVASRAVVKKVGRPFESYRGRASKRRA